MIVFGEWAQLPKGREPAHNLPVVFKSTLQIRDFQRLLIREHFNWLLIGPTVSDITMEAILESAWAVHSKLRFAVLGSLEDLARCARWVRRGCDAYLNEASTPSRVVAVIQCIERLDTLLIDRCFRTTSNQSTRPLARLSVRERQIVHLLRQGYRN